MMKRNIILLFLLPALLIAGCENPMDEHGPDAGSPTTFTATIEGGDGTKTALGTPDASGVRAVKWSDDDAISISGATYTVSSGAGTTSATFTGSGAQLDGGKYKAYYPASVYNGGTPSLPAVQDYEVAGRIDHLPMYAEDATTTLNFKNLCAVLEFKLTGTKTVGSIGLKSTEGKKLSGAFTPQNWASDSRSVVMAASASDSVTLSCGASGVALDATTPTSFFIAVPAQSYTWGTLRVTVKDLSGNEITSFTNSVSDSQLKRSEIYDIGKSTKTGVFSVTYDGETTSSTGTNVDVDRTTKTDIPFSASTLSFAVATNLGGYTVEVLDAGMNVNTTIAPVLPSADASGDNLSAPVVVSNNLNLSSFTDPGLTVFEPFSVSATQKVYFSPGNLQYQASADGVTASDNWRFAPHQWEWVGDDSHGNVYTSSTAKSTNTVEPESAREFYTGWIDLFGWGATGQRYSTNTSHRYQPWAYSGTVYGPGNENLSGKSDWGYNMGEGYRTLTGGSNGEWDYLVNKRATTEGMMSYMITKLLFSSSARIFYIRFKAKNDSEYSVTYKFQQSPGEDTYGVILFPDDFATNHATEANLCAGYFNDRYSRRELSFTDWLSLQSAGCVFLPQTASRNNNQSAAMTSINYACYWTQSFGSNNYSYNIYFTDLSGASVQIVHGSGYRYRGNAVRLVKNVTP